MPGTNHFSRMNYHVLRGMRELLSERKLSKNEWTTIRNFFNSTCAFCGCEDTGNPRTGIVPDHLIPAVEHGENCIGNIVASCQDCNDKRGKKNWRTFIQEQFPSESQSRIAKIEQYLALHPYSIPDSAHQHLTDEETSSYLEILNQWQLVWEKAVELRNAVKKRRKGG